MANGKRKSSLYSNIIFSLIALTSLSIAIVCLLLNHSIREDLESANETNQMLSDYADAHPFTQADIDNAVTEAKNEFAVHEKDALLDEMKDRLSSGDSAYALFRDIFPDDLIVYVNNGYIFYPITDELKHNDYISENFVKDENTDEISYVDDNGNVISVKGIDVSKHNGDIDWAKVKNDGIEFAFIRVGYRGSSNGGLVLDEYFKQNIEGAIENGIDVGVYFFTQAINEEEAIEEADFVLDAIEPYKITYPVVWDIETLDGRTNDLDAKTRTDAAVAFLERVKGAGYDTMLYGNLMSMLYLLETPRIEEYDKWFAYYHYPDYYPYEYSIWQYSSKGEVDGIEGEVDLNISMKSIVK
ncbi:MAG: glycoside hydrolase family 25 protein [Lachnospiraceae bacterium]|nr:glycoside hydrolase family 25 protein [Lachnospiraceae bacterium]